MSQLIRSPRSVFDWNDFGSLFSTVDDGSRGNVRCGTISVPVEISETDDNLTVEVELAGFKREDIKVNLDKNVLSISGERKFESPEAEESKRRYHVTERSYGRFARSFTLPSTVNAEKIQASYKDGILALTLPKVEAAKPREIAVG